jgi:hypothetical protein
MGASSCALELASDRNPKTAITQTLTGLCTYAFGPASGHRPFNTKMAITLSSEL